MDFKVIFYSNHNSKGLIDYSQISSGGVKFIDHIRGIDPKYRNLTPKDIRYIRCGSDTVISNSRYELLLSIDQARETGHLNDCSEISVAIDGRMNAFCGYNIKEYWVSNFFFPFLKKLEWIEVYTDIIDDDVYAAWKAAGFPREWKL